jgi:hypothetical protein
MNSEGLLPLGREGLSGECSTKENPGASDLPTRAIWISMIYATHWRRATLRPSILLPTPSGPAKLSLAPWKKSLVRSRGLESRAARTYSSETGKRRVRTGMRGGPGRPPECRGAGQWPCRRFRPFVRQLCYYAFSAHPGFALFSEDRLIDETPIRFDNFRVFGG